tara:strand:- start:5498 stop:6079 length:582 start_codon:yes stop_codon:yes gene_type:complete
MARLAGIDYSLTSPSVCTYSGEPKDFAFETCDIYFLSSTKKYSEYSFKNIDGQSTIFTYEYPEERYDFISDWAVDIVLTNEIESVYIEDYSYNSTGKVFHIAENCGLLKWKLWNSEIDYHLVSPAEIKKFASGKGNANKDLMYESFISSTDVDLKQYLESKSTKIGNPISDIIDSYYICKYGMNLLDNGEIIL